MVDRKGCRAVMGRIKVFELLVPIVIMNRKLKHTLLAIICFFFLQANLFCQDYFDYHEIINKAEIEVVKKNYEKADSLFQIAFSEYSLGFAKDFVAAAKNAQSLNNSERVKAYVFKGFNNGLTFTHIDNFPFYENLKNTFGKGNIKKELSTARKKYLGTLNKDTRKVIGKMVKRDQKVRSWWYNRKPWKVQQAFMKKVDDENFQALMSICKNQGFPGTHVIGADAESQPIYLPVLLRHMDSLKLAALKPYIMPTIKAGHFHPLDFVSALDYTSMFKSTIEDRDEDGNQVLIIQQEYGTMTGMETEGKFIYPVKSLTDLNQKRAEFGLESIADYAFKIECQIPEEGVYKKVFKLN